MSHVNTQDMQLVHGIDDVMENYLGAGQGAKAGIEVELAIFHPDDPAQRAINTKENQTLIQAGQERIPGDWIREEPSADTMEANSIAGTFKDTKSIFKDVNEKVKALSDAASSLGFKRSFFSHTPHSTAPQLLQEVVDVERYQAFFSPPRADMTGIAAYFMLCKSNQVSVSYHDPDHMLANVRRLYFLAPFLFMLSDNSSAYVEGRNITCHHGMHYRNYLGERGGVPTYLFTAQNGEEYLRNHITHVMNNLMYVYYDEEGVLQRIPSGTWSSVEQLKERGLNTLTNYHMAESILWPDVKIAALKDENGRVYNHRYESRMWGVGIHQHQTAYLITAGLAFCGEMVEKIDALLKQYGFDPDNLMDCADLLRKSYDNARTHAHQFFDIAYGTGHMAEFAKSFADLFESASCMQNFQEELQPLLRICRTGFVDGKVNRILFPNLDDAMEFQKSYDPSIFDDPNQCHHMVFADQLAKAA